VRVREAGAPARVLVVDDSATVRSALTAILSGTRAFEVAAASNPIIAQAKMRKERPDVIILDLEMPEMHGLDFLRKIMSEDPIPVVVCSALSGNAPDHAIRALEMGAVAVVEKPKLGVKQFLEDSALRFIDTVNGAVRARPRLPALPSRENHSADVVLPKARPRTAPGLERVVAVGASTGGTEALREILEALPSDAPGLLIVQHMPEGFTRAFADRLNKSCALKVKEAETGDRVCAGRALIAPGNRHLLLRRHGIELTVDARTGPLVSRHRPSVDVLFRSVAQSAGPRAMGVLLTGMGDDGAEGLLEMREAGSKTLAQDEASSVVFGMPREAIARGAVDEIVSLRSIPGRIVAFGISGRESACRPTLVP
jgi:two-component system chemotaxis response regulator CheB